MSNCWSTTKRTTVLNSLSLDNVTLRITRIQDRHCTQTSERGLRATVVLFSMLVNVIAGCANPSTNGIDDPAVSETTVDVSSGGGHRLFEQVVYAIPGPNAGVHEAAWLGVVHFDDRCIWIEFDDPGPQYDEAYTLLFLTGRYGQHVDIDANGDLLTIYYSVRTWRGSSGTLDPRLATVARFRSGERAWVAGPNAWSREHMSPETLMLRTEPHPECPERFWLPGTMTPAHPLDVDERLELPMVPHPAVYATG